MFSRSALRCRARFAFVALLAGCGGGPSSPGPSVPVQAAPTPAATTPVSAASPLPTTSPAPAGASPAPSGFSSPAPAVTATPVASSSATAATPVASVSPGTTPAASATPGGSATATSATEGGPLCLPITPATTLASPLPLRFGIDTGAAGNLVPVSTESAPPDDMQQELTALAGLSPAHPPLVVRLNRLFWSGGEPLLQQFASDASGFSQAGYDVEVQVRYHPDPTEVDDLTAWTAYVRHVVDVLGANPNLVALTITNEVNFDVSPNTSDGAYPGAMDALIQGIEAASDEARIDGYGSRIRMGFTFAYRLDPATDAALFTYLDQVGGAAFRQALGFVGLDDYPGTVYPPTLSATDTAGDEMGKAIATMRDCYLPLAEIPPATPLWVTENGYSSASTAYAAQASDLSGTIDTVRALSGTYDVTDYRYFNLRDNLSTGTGTFDQDGLLLDTYAPKTSYGVYRSEIAVP